MTHPLADMLAIAARRASDTAEQADTMGPPKPRPTPKPSCAHTHR